MNGQMSEAYEKYAASLEGKLEQLYAISRKAREKGLDPALKPECEIAKDLADLVEGLVGPKGVAESIRKLSTKLPREELAFKVAEEIVYGKFGHMEPEAAAEKAVRTALAVLTEGLTAAPLQGVAKVKIKTNHDRTRYLAIYFAGPIRSAGGTDQALTLVVGDFVRRLLGLERYKPTEEEIARFIEEVRLYERSVSRFQYHVSDEELRRALQWLPVEVTGTESDPIEVSSFRNLPRIEANRVRGGALRVVNDGVVGRSSKVWTIIEKLGIQGWDWLKEIHQASEKKSAGFMDDVIAGRPIFSFPSRRGGFRLRYGRARNTGLAAVGIHPATMLVLQGFLAAGTQLRLELPGKGGIAVPVDAIEPPIVKLKGGSVVRVSVENFGEIKNRIEKILFLGDILISFGDFLYNSKLLAPSGYVEEWWVEDLRKAVMEKFNGNFGEAADAVKIPLERLKSFLENSFVNKPNVKEATALSLSLDIPLHPSLTFFWSGLASVEELGLLRKWLLNSEIRCEDGFVREIVGETEAGVKKVLETICLPHKILDGKIIVEDDDAHAFAFCLGYNTSNVGFSSARSVLEAIRVLSGVLVREKAPTLVGARMGRPEKAKRREMKPLVHVLFPVGLAGGSQRNIVEAAKREPVFVEVVKRRCPVCKSYTFRIKCPACGSVTVLEKICPRCGRSLKGDMCPICKVSAKSYGKQAINFRELLESTCSYLGVSVPKVLKGVKGLINETKTPEIIEKGVLRAKHDLSVYKDGTIRFDATNAPLSLDYNEQIYIINENGDLEFVRIGEFVDQLMKQNGSITDASGFEILDGSRLKFRVLSFNPLTLRVKPKKVTGFIRHKANRELYRVRTATGREIVVTKYHSLFTLNPDTGKIVPIETEKLCPGSFIAIPRKIPYEKDVKHINLLTVFAENPDQIRVKAPKQLFRRMINELGGTSHVARTISINRSTVNGWIMRGNMPLKMFLWLANKSKTSINTKYLKKNKFRLAWTNSRGLKIPAILPINDAFLRLIGYYLSEGWCWKGSKIYQSRTLGFRNFDKEILDDFVECFYQLFHNLPKIRKKETGVVYVNSNLLAEIITKVFKCGSRSSDKRIPEFILSLPLPKLAQFLRAYFSGDGYVSKTTSHHIGCSTISRTLADGLLFSLLRFGIMARVKKRNRLPKGICEYSMVQPIYEIAFGGRENLERFYNHITFIQEENMEALKHYLKNTPRHPWRTDVMPLKRFLRISLGKNTFMNMRFDRGGTITRANLGKIARAISDRPSMEALSFRLATLVNSDLFFDKVEAIDRIPPTSEYVYDLEVQPNGKKIENFISGFGGIFAHNTHFKPSEVGVSAEKLRQLGYTCDVYGAPLTSPNQMCELKIQDVVVPRGCAGYFMRVANFVDELLTKVYGLSPYYEVKRVEDLVGLLVVGLAPHTSVGILGRIVGFTNLNVCYAHPVWHSAKRRDCDGDEDSLMLALEAFVNFSREYLPAQIGGIMDAPLLLIPIVNTQEVQRQAHDVDVACAYPIEFYEKTWENVEAKRVSRLIDLIEYRLGTEAQFEGFNYTTPVSNINLGNPESAYKRFKTMIEKLNSQLELAEKIEAVDAKEVALKVLTTHFIRDIAGNLRAFSTQGFRCKSCNRRFRRLPLRGKCPSCGGSLTLTVYRGGIEKYLEVAQHLVEKYGLPQYYAQRIQLMREEINALFEGKKPRQISLVDFV